MPKPVKYVAADGTVTWRVRLRLHGKQTSETFDTRRDALLFCDDVEANGAEAAVRARVRDLANARGVTLDELFEEWAARAERRVRSDRTVADYRRDWKNWTSPTLGRLPAASVTAADVQGWVDDMDKGDKKTGRKPLSAKSIADRHAVLHGVIKWGMSSGRKGGPVIDADPCAGTELPKRPPRQPKGLLPAEWAKLYVALQATGQDTADLALFLVGTGWRLSEARALSSYSVEDDGRAMHVTMGWVIRRTASGANVRVDDAKSKGSKRRTSVDPELAEMIRRRLPVDGTDRLVFTNGGRPWSDSVFRKRWTRAVKAAGLEAKHPTPHGLRHTHAGWLLMSGKASLVDVSRRLGHANIATTVDIYGSLVSDVSGDAVAAVAAMRGTGARAIGQ